MHSKLVACLLLSNLYIIHALPATFTLDERQALSGYQTQCLHDVAIAFDDGPYIYNTELVDEMVSYGTLGTFFVNGYNWGCIYSDGNIAALRQAYESGFTIGSHTWNHYDITLGTIEQLGEQLDLVETALLRILGAKPALFRPPYGSINEETLSYLNSRGYTVAGWSDDTGDSTGADVAEQKAVLDAAEPGNLFLAHETYQSTVEETIPDSIPGLVARGLQFITVDQCLDIPAYQSAGAAYGIKDDTWTCEGTPVPGEDFKRS